ncbi:hypothetical protein C5C18_11750 [Rathayibacter tritici]|uniref:ArsR/SmtB family transcription factor n=1 Tax=Rathayibacter tritici TaxID=33888 RepID=UPI000CE90AEC|nr:helix-turn-helix transcriptional regulator [Rathayibacter tritici]PPF66182.1 hypothetical protein C5C21_09850 [Rathayibacter tritici]PPG05954.1 hypothetical protein C5C18_11750 [Rathayibacter tritici]
MDAPRDDDHGDLLRAMKALSNPSKVDIIRYLASVPQATGGLIQASTNLARATLNLHLRELEDLHLVTVDVDLPRGQRTGHGPRYSLDVKRLESIADQQKRFLLRLTDDPPGDVL